MFNVLKQIYDSQELFINNHLETTKKTGYGILFSIHRKYINVFCFCS